MRLVAVGDLMLGDHPVCFGHGVRSTIEKKGFDFIFNDEIIEYFKGADLTLGNLETVLSDFGYEPDNLEKAELRGASIYAEGLAKTGFNILNIANNHMLQHGSEAFIETVESISKVGILPLGLQQRGKSKKVIFDGNDGNSVALLGFSLRPEKYYKQRPLYSQATESDIIKQVEELVVSFKGAVVVSLHWGEEYLNIPSFGQVKFARRLVDIGVKLVLGHHPHVLQGIEEYGSGVIVYSLGNFVFDKWQRNPRESILFTCDITNDGVKAHSEVPVYISKQFQPCIARGKNKKRIVDNISFFSSEIANDLLDDDVSYREKAEKAYLKFRMQSYIYFLRHIYKYNPKIIMGSLLRFIKRRVS